MRLEIPPISKLWLASTLAARSLSLGPVRCQTTRTNARSELKGVSAQLSQAELMAGAVQLRNAYLVSM